MAWNNIGRIRGPTGPPGPVRGVAVFTGTNPPPEGQDGDLWFADDGTIRRATGGDWVFLGRTAPFATWDQLHMAAEDG